MDALETDLVKLRALEPEDVDILYLWENDLNVWRVSNTVTPFSKHILRRFIANQRYDIYETKQLRLIIEANRRQAESDRAGSDHQGAKEEGEAKEGARPVGAIDLFDLDPYNRRAGVGILIYDPRDKGQGYASSALGLLIRYCFDILMLNQLYCNVDANNTRSLALFRSKEFTTVGLKKEWVRTTADWQDEYLLQLINPKKY